MAFVVDIVTLVPELWPTLLSQRGGLVGRAFSAGLAELRLCSLKDFGKGAHRQVDDAPFGGGAGMVLAVEPLHKAIASVRARSPGPVILLDPRGQRFDQALARQLAEGAGLSLVCGRYEGVDERVRAYVDREISIGDFVLSGGDPAAWCVIDAVVRLLPGVLGNADSIRDESFSQPDTLEYPQYTRPAEYDGRRVPDVLLSGNHAEIERWRREQALGISRGVRRPGE